MKKLTSNKISYTEYLRREYDVEHAPFEPEMDFYDAIQSGNVNKVIKLCEESFVDKEGLGILSDNPLQNMKYHYVISVAMIARVCINSGLLMSEAYTMSDYYIQKADKAKSLSEISTLHDEVCLAYTKRMKRFQKENIYSRHVVKCVDYIYSHLNTRITVEDLCEITGLSDAYISRLFKKETGYTISDYISLKKIETAKSMLLYSSYSISDIALELAFPSQSYFSKIFKANTGKTPLQFRKYKM